MAILVKPRVAKGICPVGTHVLPEYGGGRRRCTEATWLQSVVGTAQGPSPLPSMLALLLMLCNFQLRWSRSPPLLYYQPVSLG